MKDRFLIGLALVIGAVFAVSLGALYKSYSYHYQPPTNLAVKSDITKAVGTKNTIRACENSIKQSITSNGGTVTSLKFLGFRGNNVVVRLDSNVASLPLLCTFRKSVWQLVGVQPTQYKSKAPSS